MTSDDFGRTTREWLDEGPTRMSDRALEDALDEIHLTPQRRAWWLAKRLPTFPLWVRAAAIVVVVLGAVAIESNLRPTGVGGPIGGPSPTAPATPTASPQPTETTSSIALTYGVQYPYRLHLTVPATWDARDLDLVIQKNGGAAATTRSSARGRHPMAGIATVRRPQDPDRHKGPIGPSRRIERDRARRSHWLAHASRTEPDHGQVRDDHRIRGRRSHVHRSRLHGRAGFVDPGDGHIHILRNEGAIPAETVAVQLLPHGAGRRIDVPDPENC